MTDRFPQRPSPSMLVAIAAVVIASTGTAVAATIITSRQIKDRSIRLVDISPAARQALQGQRGLRGLAGATGATGANGLSGAKGDTGSAGANGLSKAYHLTRTSAVNPLPTAATTVATLTALPPGDYLVGGSATAVNFGVGDYVRCNIAVGATTFSGASAYVGATSTPPAEGMTTTAAVSSVAAFNADLRCGHDSMVAGPYVEGIEMWAIPVNNVDVRTVP